MSHQPRLIIQLPRGGAVDRQLAAQTPPSVSSGDVVIDPGPTDDEGYLEAPAAGQVVMSVPSPEGLARQAAEELRDDELAPILEAAGRSSRAVILRIMGDG
jgi:hypothetical protein